MNKTYKINLEYLVLLIIIALFISQYNYATDFVSGKLDYKWLTGSFTNKDMKFAGVLIISGGAFAFTLQTIYIKVFKK